MSNRLLTTGVLISLCVLLGACGGSSRAPGVEPVPSAGSTTAPPPATTTTSTSSSTSTSAAIKPPPQLSSKPIIAVPSAPPPKKLLVRDLIKGTGKAATVGSTITVNYVGVLYKGGKEFDSSWKRGQPFTTALTSGAGGVIDGWVKGVAGMKVGGRRELIIPPKLAYGKSGQPGIPPNSALIFVIDLLRVG